MMIIDEWSSSLLISTNEPFIIIFLHCPPEEGSDSASLVGTWVQPGSTQHRVLRSFFRSNGSHQSETTDVPWLLIASDVLPKVTSKTVEHNGSDSELLSIYHSNYLSVFSIVLGTTQLSTAGISDLHIEGVSLYEFTSRWLILLSEIVLL